MVNECQWTINSEPLTTVDLQTLETKSNRINFTSFSKRKKKLKKITSLRNKSHKLILISFSTFSN